MAPIAERFSDYSAITLQTARQVEGTPDLPEGASLTEGEGNGLDLAVIQSSSLV